MCTEGDERWRLGALSERECNAGGTGTKMHERCREKLVTGEMGNKR